MEFHVQSIVAFFGFGKLKEISPKNENIFQKMLS